MTLVDKRRQPVCLIRNSELSSLFCFLLVLAALLMVGGCHKVSEPIQQVFNGETMGTYYRLSLVDAGSDDTHAIEESIERILAKVNQSMSTYLPDSEVSRFNQLEVGQTLLISEDFAWVLSKALELEQLSDGAFDVTIGPLVRLWGFGPDGSITHRPAPEELRARLSIVGSDKLALNNRDLRKLANVELDLSAIAKGYAIDLIAEYLTEQGYQHWLIDVGGELRARGTKQDRLWQVAIEEPGLSGGIQQSLTLTNQAIATSGDYRNFIILEGQAYSHAIDPNTGLPVKHGLASVSVLHSSAMMADAWATALLVMGESAARLVADKYGLSVYLIVRGDSAETFTTVSMGEFERLTH